MILDVPRVVPESRLKDLLQCATRVFIEQGYRRTQIADVAQALGVAKGTVYLSVDSKEALFHAADSDSSGAIDVNEFAALVTRLLQAQELLPASEAGTDAEIAEAFRKFDEDDSG